MSNDIRTFDRRVVKIVEIVDDGNVPHAFAEQAVEPFGAKAEPLRSLARYVRDRDR